MVLYHDIYKIGYQRICRSVQLDFPANDHSLMHNAEQLRLCLKNWTSTKILLGTVNEYKLAARHVNKPSPLKDVCLWTDSVDVPLIKAEDRGRTSNYWSHKLGRPGRRYLCFFDGLGQLRKVFGGHSPKWHDGEFLKNTRILDQ